MIKIQQIDLSNLDDLIPLFDGYRIFYKAESDLPATRHFLSERITRKESTIFCAYIDNVAVGFTQIYPMFSSVSMQSKLVLNDLYVDPSYRKQGIGEALLERGKKLTIDLNAKCLILETGIKNPAQDLYERLGWVKDVEFFHYEWTAPK